MASLSLLVTYYFICRRETAVLRESASPKQPRDGERHHRQRASNVSRPIPHGAGSTPVLARRRPCSDLDPAVPLLPCRSPGRPVPASVSLRGSAGSIVGSKPKGRDSPAIIG